VNGAPFVADGPAGALHGVDGGRPSARPAVVFVHGINGSARDWAGVAARLGDERRAVAFDLRGHGASVSDGPYGARDYLGDLVAVLDDRGIDRAHVVGASFGGSVAIAAGAQCPERVCSITVLGGALRVDDPPDIDGGVAAMRQVGATTVFASLLGEISFAPGTDATLVADVAARAGARSVDVIAEVTRTGFAEDITELAAGCHVPALVLVGELDRTTPVTLAQRLAEALSTAPTVLAGRGHLAMLEDAAAVAGPIRAHLSAHDTGHHATADTPSPKT
jgi:3-oxoadipate enol-lactonase